MQYDLVFEGGGAKGMVFVGAMQEFEARGHTTGRLLGTSAGAITAALIAAGYSAEELLKTLSEQEGGQAVFASFMDSPPAYSPDTVLNSQTRDLLRTIDFPFVPNFVEDKLDDWLVGTLASQPRTRHIYGFLEHGGWFSADSFLTWLRRKLDSGTYEGTPRQFSQMTLGQFYATTGRHLSLVASDTTDERMLVLNHTTAPDCPLVWAVRMSMSIPLVWPEVVWQPDWGRYRGRLMTDHYIVDGGLLSNFPIELLVSDQRRITNIMGRKEHKNVLGLLIDETKAVPGASVNSGDENNNNRFDLGQIEAVQRILRLINTATKAHDKMVIEAFEQLVIRLPAQGFGTTEFGMPEARRQALINAGRQATRAFFETRAREIDLRATVAAPAPAEMDAASYADKMAEHMLEE